jgi:hypothetical integral membrane protein (TIGR02206 family)
MSSLQLYFICATFLVPLALWLAFRGRSTPAHERAIAWALAGILIVAYVGALYFKHTGQGLNIDATLPMQLCDWAAVATLLALLGRRQTAFELAYCWGLAGTLQALFTPAVEVKGGPQVWCFLTIHSVIPAAVIWMLLGRKMRPSWACWRHVALWSQVYFLTALAVNWLMGSNYGFLSARPSRASLLDYFPDPWPLYVLSVNAFALALFAVMLAPWRLAKKAV